MKDDARDSGPDATSSDPGPGGDAARGPSSGGPRMRDLFEDAARAIGRTAGRTRDALARLSERGALAVAARRLEHTRAQKLKELGEVARKALSTPGGLLRRDDARVAELIQAIDRLDEKLARMRERIHKTERAAEEESGRKADAGEGKNTKTDDPPER